MTLWNTPPGYLAGDGALTRAAAEFMRDTQALDLEIANAGWSGDAAVRRRQDAYASAQELAEAVRDQERLTRRLEAAVAAAEEPLKRVVFEAEFTDEQVERMARVVHAANCQLQADHGDPAPSAPWDSETGETRAAAVAGVRAALRGVTPEELHAEWCRNKAKQGWRRGEFKDPILKTHPCLVPYADLPEEQRVKDRVFTAIVAAMAAEAAAGGTGENAAAPTTAAA